MESARTYQGIRWQRDEHQGVMDELAIEHPLSIYVNDELLTITMQTPGDELQLVIGMLYTEGVYKVPEPVPFSLLSQNRFDYIDEIRMSVPERLLGQAALTKRNMLSSSSCGICGTTELPLLEGKIEGEDYCDEATIQQCIRQMADQQVGYRASGGCHGAAAFSFSGQLLSLKEDIGRHNAVDKVVGDLLMKDQLSQARLLTVSGRVSYEIVYKCFAAGIPTLAAVSAPSSLGVDYCKDLGIRLFGFCREDRMTRYA